MTPIVPEHRSGLSRRTVLAGAAGLAGLGLLTLSGCSPARSNPTIPEAAATGTAKRGGRLRIARPAASAAETLDLASSLSAYAYLGALYNRLVKLDEQGVTSRSTRGAASRLPTPSTRSSTSSARHRLAPGRSARRHDRPGRHERARPAPACVIDLQTQNPRGGRRSTHVTLLLAGGASRPHCDESRRQARSGSSAPGVPSPAENAPEIVMLSVAACSCGTGAQRNQRVPA